MERETLLVGRELELAQLHGCLDKALQGARQIVFVAGEAGIGKTTLVEAFLLGIRSVWIGQGQCVEHYGTGEAYLPVLEALGRLCRGPGGKRLIALLERHAPDMVGPDAGARESRPPAGPTKTRAGRHFGADAP